MLNVTAERHQMCHPGGSGTLTVSQHYLFIQTVLCSSWVRLHRQVCVLSQNVNNLFVNCNEQRNTVITNTDRVTVNIWGQKRVAGSDGLIDYM